MAHAYDPPFRMGYNDVFYSHIPGSFHNSKNFLRCDVSGSQYRIVVADQFQHGTKLRHDLSIFYDLHALAQILVHLLHMVFCRLGRKPYYLSTQTKRHIDCLRIDAADYLI